MGHAAIGSQCPRAGLRSVSDGRRQSEPVTTRHCEVRRSRPKAFSGFCRPASPEDREAYEEEQRKNAVSRTAQDEGQDQGGAQHGAPEEEESEGGSEGNENEKAAEDF